ncbi:ATP-binding cassette domain-containing protein [Microaerobacter geothermalis]|uniref:ABC transporter ATP-binding protein n=1 Tax=Microaerobacter geothermalis TaxID=674972 RepID=UPI001F2C5452|nr:ATP-binding cassette domain-containing protein [Microaerobacter geothermalis]MCF6095332.1 ATP-binding cassette domain-containing protein [Microaerobacter geothermalis]
MEYRIEARKLTKEFKSYKSRKGIGGAMRDLLTRQYTTVRAVDSLDLQIKSGEMVGYIGENGAGKSTTIKMLTGILVPTSGKIRVNGMVPFKERERFARTIGVVFGQRSQLWWDIAVQESFRLLKKVYKVSDEAYEKQMELMLDVLDIHSLLDRPVRKLSLGQRMRCELAAALIHNPPLLFLDEPTIGLDVLVKLKIREFLTELNRTLGTTIMLTTHDLTDIEALCSRVVILDEGKKIYDGELSTLKEQWGGEKRVILEFTHEIDVDQWRHLSDQTGMLIKPIHPLKVQVDLSKEVTISDIIGFFGDQEIKDIQMQEVSTEEIVRKIYEEGVSHGQSLSGVDKNPVSHDVSLPGKLL